MGRAKKKLPEWQFIGFASVFWFLLIEALPGPDLRDQECTPTGSMTTLKRRRWLSFSSANRRAKRALSTSLLDGCRSG
jgi:hypothetical protein